APVERQVVRARVTTAEAVAAPRQAPVATQEDSGKRAPALSATSTIRRIRPIPVTPAPPVTPRRARRVGAWSPRERAAMQARSVARGPVQMVAGLTPASPRRAPRTQKILAKRVIPLDRRLHGPILPPTNASKGSRRAATIHAPLSADPRAAGVTILSVRSV